MQRKLFVGVMFLLFTTVFAAATFAQGGGKTPPPNLNGTWTNEAGEEVDIHQDAVSGRVYAIFDKGDCPDKSHSHRPKYIEGHLAGYSLSGTMWRCTGSKPLIEDCGLDPVFTTTFKTTLVSDNLIKGTRRSEWYGPKKEDGQKKDDGQKKSDDRCKFARDSSGDKDIDFTLTRKGLECPDTAKVQHFYDVSDRAARFTAAAASYVKDGQLHTALDKSQSTLREFSNALSRLVKLGKKCEEIHDALDEIYQFEAAIDQINNAGCDSQALAGGFDNLFQAFGKIGKRFVKIPELQPLFEILSENSNFFQKVSGALDPEHRWADQFAGIDGYVPNCSQK
jgi:hypothetical protein